MDYSTLIRNDHIIIAQSVAANISSGPIDTSSIINIAVQCVYSGTPTGTITIECSNDGVHFDTLDTISLTGSSGNKMKNYPDTGYKYIQVRYIAGSGSGTLDVYVSGKRD